MITNPDDEQFYVEVRLEATKLVASRIDYICFETINDMVELQIAKRDVFNMYSVPNVDKWICLIADLVVADLDAFRQKRGHR